MSQAESIAEGLDLPAPLIAPRPLAIRVRLGLRWLWKRPDVLATLVLVPLTLALSFHWGFTCNPLTDFWNYTGLWGFKLLVTLPVTLVLFVVAAKLAGQSAVIRQLNEVRIKSFGSNLLILYIMSWIYTYLKAGVLLGASHDEVLCRIDVALFGGVEPWTFLKEHLTAAWWGVLLGQVYLIFFLVILGTIFWFTLAKKYEKANELTCAIVLAYYIGLAGYHLFPAYGPAYYVSSADPAALNPTIANMQQLLLINTRIAQEYPGVSALQPWSYVAAFPSLHMSHVLILMWYVRSSRLGLAVMGLFAALTGLSCVYLGWHYVVDLIAGVGVATLAVAVTALFRTARKRSVLQPAAA